MSFLTDLTGFAGPVRFAVVLSVFLALTAVHDILDTQAAVKGNRKLKNYAVVVLCAAAGMLIVAAVMVLLFLAGLRPGEMAEALGSAHIVLILAVMANIMVHRNKARAGGRDV